MTDTIRNIFISCVSSDFGDLRDILAEELRSPLHNILVQRSFVPGGATLLDKLVDYVKQSDVIVHLIGESTGDYPQNTEVRTTLERLESSLEAVEGTANILKELRVRLDLNPQDLSYSQWEFWLALLFKRECLVIRDAKCFPGGLDDVSRLSIGQQRHVDNLRKLGHDLTAEFATWESICRVVLRYLNVSVARLPRTHPRWTDLDDIGNLIISRPQEIDTANLLLETAECLILWGAGGSGKTTLAQEILRAFQNRGGRGLWIDLLSCADDKGIRSEILNAVQGVRTYERVPSQKEPSLGERLESALSVARPQLIVLDNAEHVRHDIGHIVRELHAIESLTDLRIVVTSQNRLLEALPEAVALPVDPFAYPDPAEPETWNANYTTRSQAARLFVRRTAGRLQHIDATNWESVATICYTLRGYPLSLAITGGYYATHPEVSLDDLTASVRRNGGAFENAVGSLSQDAAAKADSVLASVRWSLGQCAPADQQLVRLLAHLPDGFTSELAAVLATHAPSARTFAERLSLLCAASLLQAHRAGRYRLVESVRSQVIRLNNREVPESLELCLKSVLQLIRPSRVSVVCAPANDVILTLAAERGNILALLEASQPYPRLLGLSLQLLAEYAPVLDRIGPAAHVVERVRPFSTSIHVLPVPDRCRLVSAYSHSLWAAGRWHDASRECRLLLDDLMADRSSTGNPTHVIPWLSTTAASIDVLLFVLDTIRIQTFEDIGGPSSKNAEGLVAWAAQILAAIQSDEQCSSELKAFLEGVFVSRHSRLLDRQGHSARSIDLVTAFMRLEVWPLVPDRLRASLQNERGLSEWHLGNLDAATILFREASEGFRRVEDSYWLAGSLTNLAFVLTDLGQLDDAIVLCEEADRLHRQVNNRTWEGTNHGALGMALFWNGQVEEGLKRLEMGLSLTRAEDIETSAQFKGDIARVLLDRGRACDIDRASILLEEAIDVQSHTAVPTRRQFGNSVLLADAMMRNGGSVSELREATSRSRRLAEAAGFVPQSRVLQIRRDFRRLKSIEDALEDNK